MTEKQLSENWKKNEDGTWTNSKDFIYVLGNGQKAKVSTDVVRMMADAIEIEKRRPKEV